jgi:hypothetical protein
MQQICRLSTAIQIIQPTRCNSFTSLLLDVYMRLNMFRASPRPSSGAYNCTRSLWFYNWKAAAGVLLVVVWPVNRPDHNQQRSTHCSPTVLRVRASVLQRVFICTYPQLYDTHTHCGLPVTTHACTHARTHTQIDDLNSNSMYF